MHRLNKDELSVISMNLDLPVLLNLCESSKDLKEKVCNNPNVWNYKLDKDYPEYKELDLSFLSPYSPRELYVFMYQLNYIKKLLNTKETLKDIFLKKQLDLGNKKLKKIPAFNLPNLERLYLYGNQLTEVPNFNLPNLQELYLYDNQLTEVPPFNLPNLKELYLYDNQLTEVPNFNLRNLQLLSLHHNQLKKVPQFNLPNLLLLSLRDNKLTEIQNFNLPNLQELYLKNNQLTERSKTEIKKKYGNKVYI